MVVVVESVVVVVVAVAARHLQVDDEGVRDARQDLPFDLRLRDDLLVGGRVLTSALQDRLHRELFARIGASHLEPEVEER